MNGKMAKSRSQKKVEDFDFFTELRGMERETGIPAPNLAEKIAAAICVAAKKSYGGQDIVHCDINCEKRIFKVYLRKNVVENPENAYTDISPDDAKKYDPDAEVGSSVDIPLDPKQFGRIVAQSAKHVIRQGIREAQRGQTLEEFQSKARELVTAEVQAVDPKTGNATVTIGKYEAVLPKTEQVPGEILEEGDNIKVFIVEAKDTEKGPKAMISRTHPWFVGRLFEKEIPEIYDGTVEIKNISRQAGSRTKMAVYCENPDFDAVGACIGQHGMRVNAIVEELGGEKIDIVNYSENPEEFISEAMKPAKVLEVEILSEDPKTCRVTVPDSQLSLAIGNKGQNVRLAAKLTGWKIDIRPESGYYGEDAEN